MPPPLLPVCVEAPALLAPRVRYAAEELLRGLGLAPAWTERGGLAGGGLYYGPDPEASPPRALALRMAPEASHALARPRVLRPEAYAWLEHEGARAPLPFGRGGKGEAGGVVEADLLASAFWWLARVHEEASPARDRHGRAPFAASPQAALGTALVPAVDVYRAWLGAALRARGLPVPGRTWGGAPWALALTHDVDAVGLRRGRALARAALGLRPLSAWRALTRPDPRRASLHALVALARRRGLGSTFFVKGGASAPEDVPYRLGPLAPWLRGLRAEGFEVGLHPSYHAHDHPGRLGAERGRLVRALGGQPPQSARTHFLRWAEGGTPRALRDAGFALDSTLGWADHEGFRCGTTHPFRLYSRAENRPTDLWEAPLALMDTTIFGYRGLEGDAAGAALRSVMDAARRWGGCAALLWHPDLGDDRPARWAARLRLLDDALGDALRTGARAGPLGGLVEGWR